MRIKRWKVYLVFAIVACSWFACQIIVHQKRWRELERFEPWGWLSEIVGMAVTRRSCGSALGTSFDAAALQCAMDDKGFAVIHSRRRVAMLDRDGMSNLGASPRDWTVPYARESPGLWLFLDRSTGTLFVMIEGPPLPSSGAPSYLLLDFFLDGHAQLADGVAAFLARLDDMGRHDDPPTPPVWRADRAPSEATPGADRGR